MTRAPSILCNPFVSMTLIASGVAAIGCVDGSPSDPAGKTVDQQVTVDQRVITDRAAVAGIAMQPAVRLDRAGQGTAVSPIGAGWTQTAPGLWNNASASGTRVMAIGAEGHRSAIAKAEAELAALQRAGDDAGVEQKAAYLAQLKATSLAIPAAVNAPQVTCNLSDYIGPSSPVLPGVIGAAAIGQADCVEGSVTFTIETQACSDLGCTAFNIVTGTASPGLPFVSGVAIAGTAGAACSGTVIFIPPGLTVTGAGPCG